MWLSPLMEKKMVSSSSDGTVKLWGQDGALTQTFKDTGQDSGRVLSVDISFGWSNHCIGWR